MMTWNELLSRLSGREVEFSVCPPEDCAGPDGSFPIRKQQDVYDAAKHLDGHPQAEKIKKALKKIAKRKGFRLPQELQDTHSDMSVEADLTDDPQATFDGYVVKTGKVFECGSWDDKDFEFDESDADRAVETFKPVPLDLEHMPTILDGKLGMVEKLWRKGKELFAQVNIDSRLIALLGNVPIRVSCTWDRTTKTLHKLALVNHPRIEDAVLMAAFADNTNPPVTPTLGDDKETPHMKVPTWEDFVAFMTGRTEEETPDKVGPAPKVEPAVLAPFKVEETPEFKNLQAELVKAREASDAKFKADNEATIDRLIAEFKIEVADKQKYVDLRAKDAAMFDAIAKDMKPLPHLSGKTDLDAQQVLDQMQSDPKAQAQFQADLKGLIARGLYQPF